jgi:prephenate dehydrogenase
MTPAQPNPGVHPTPGAARDAKGAPALRSVLIVGSGLIGSSIGLALREMGIEVALEDNAPGRLALAVELGAGRPRAVGETFDVAVMAVPPGRIGVELLRVQQLGVARTLSDVGSAKAQPQADAQAYGVDLSRYVGGHPVAGRERSGPAAAHSDLFVGRPWVITPTPAAAAEAVDDVRALALACGAVPVEMSADEHDAALATVSHLPHVVAALLAAQLTGASKETVALGGSGLHDTTRVAAGDAGLWTDILAANSTHLAAALRAFAADAQRMVQALEGIESGDEAALATLTRLLEAGATGRARVPLKRGETAAQFATVPIVVRDAPGELAALLRALGDAGINVEDVRVEHEPGRPIGVVEIDVHEDAAPALIACMQQSGWQVYS